MTDVRRAMLEVERLILDDPLARYGRARLDSLGISPLHRPEDVLAIQKLTALYLLDWGAEWPDGNRLEDELVLALVLQTLQARPHLWLDGTHTAALDMPIPEHVVPHSLLAESPLWFTFERPWGVYPVSDADPSPPAGTSGFNLGAMPAAAPDYYLAGLLLVDQPGRVDVWSIGIGGDAEGHAASVTSSVVPTGVRFSPRADRDLAQATLAMLGFLNSPFIPTSEMRLDRRLRKSLERSGWKESAKDAVRFVDLRPAAERETDGPGRMPQERHWRHRWLVRGHLRAQWYPSEQAHHLMWIAPHVKGPKDAPLKRTVYRVSR